MVPEIFLTPQIFHDFQSSFGDKVFLYHSGLTPIQRIKVWLAAQDKSPKIIIGTRSSVFLPIRNLGGIVFDEEHDQSYKQQESFRYEAKEITKILYKDTARIIYASATPSLINIKKANDGDLEKCSLTKRISDTPMPIITIHDVNKSGLMPAFDSVGNASIHEECYPKLSYPCSFAGRSSGRVAVKMVLLGHNGSSAKVFETGEAEWTLSCK